MHRPASVEPVDRESDSESDALGGHALERRVSGGDADSWQQHWAGGSAAHFKALTSLYPQMYRLYDGSAQTVQ